MRKRYRYQLGGERRIPGPMANDPALLPRAVTDPREAVRMYFVDNSKQGDIATYYRLPSAIPVEDLQEKIAREQEKKAALAIKEERKRRSKIPLAPVQAMKGDIATYFRLPNNLETDLGIQKTIADHDRLQKNLERLGYNEVYATIFARQGRDKLSKSMQEQLERLEQDDYRVQHHPDYDPSIPIERQQYLNYDNSLRTMLLRGRNLLVDSGNPVADFVTDVVTYPGKAFVNMTMDADKQYIQPGPLQGTLNFGTDVLALFPSVANQASNRIVNRLVSRGLPEASLLMERTLGKPAQLSIQELKNTILRSIQENMDEEVPVYVNAAQYPSGKVNMKKYENILSQRFSEYPPSSFNYKLEALNQEELDQFVTDILKDIKDNMVSKKAIPKGYDPKQLKNISKEVDQALLDYYQLTKDPRYIERVRNLDKKLKMEGELERRLKLFHQQGELVQSGKGNFNLQASDDIQAVASSSWPEEASILHDFANNNEIPALGAYLRDRYYSPQERQIFWSPKYLTNPEYNIKSTMFHEGKHHWTNALGDRENSIYKYTDWLRGRIPKEYDRSYGSLGDYLYYSSPTEVDAYLMTELRNDLVNTGYLTDHFDNLTEDALNDYLRRKVGDKKLMYHLDRYFNPSSGLIKGTRAFIKKFNKTLPVTIGVGAGVGAMSETQNKIK